MAREGVLRQGVLPLPLREIELSAHALRAMTKIIECLTVLAMDTCEQLKFKINTMPSELLSECLADPSSFPTYSWKVILSLIQEIREKIRSYSTLSEQNLSDFDELLKKVYQNFVLQIMAHQPLALATQPHAGIFPAASGFVVQRSTFINCENSRIEHATNPCSCVSPRSYDGDRFFVIPGSTAKVMGITRVAKTALELHGLSH